MSKMILFLAASPTDQARSRLDVEFRDIEACLQRAPRRDDFKPVSRFAVRATDLRQALQDHQPWLVHFSGHGEGDNGLLLEDDSGLSHPLDGAVLGDIFQLMRDAVACVLLNACYSEGQAQAIARHIPYVIGMQNAIADDAAILFATAFYQALGTGEPIARAFHWGKAALRMAGKTDRPVLFRSGQVVADNGLRYDIFISYRFTQREWAEILAHNLVAQGYKVFFDDWELYASQDFHHAIEQALADSRCAILVATPEAADSGWVQREYEWMAAQEAQQRGFFCIPVVWGEFPDFPFLDTRHAVDFATSEETHYRAAFQRLLAALQQQPPGPEPYFDGLLKLPPTPHIVPAGGRRRSFVADLFSTYIDNSTPVMVLAQEDTRHYAQALKDKAQARYGTVLHLFPPASVQASSDRYFARLAAQCGFAADIDSSWAWCDAMDQRLYNADELFLLITGFENGAEDARRDLAGELRGLLEAHPMNFKLVIMGGERLAAMKYEHGEMSFLNKLEEVPLPPMGVEDVRDVYLVRYHDLSLSDALLREVLAFSGQHPRLVEACLRALQRGQKNWQAAVMAGSLPAQLFARFRDAAEQATLCEYLKRDNLGWYSTWPPEELVRRLYWQNLLTGNDQGRLTWRSERIREIGRGVLGC